MQINSISANNKYSASTAFKARIPNDLQKDILKEAVEYGSEGLSRAKAQIEKFKTWGQADTVLEKSFDFAKGKEYLGISNYSISKNYGADFKTSKSNLLDSFMSLKEADVIEAENKISEEVQNSKLDLFKKALLDNSLMKKITGTEKPSKELISSSIDKLDEDVINDLRFNLNDPSKFKNDTTLDFDF